jgi:hypothetical protein
LAKARQHYELHGSSRHGDCGRQNLAQWLDSADSASLQRSGRPRHSPQPNCRAAETAKRSRAASCSPRRLCVHEASACSAPQRRGSCRWRTACAGREPQTIAPQLLSRAATTAAAQIRAPQKPCGCATAVRMIPTPRGARRSGTGDRAQQPLATGDREQRDATGPTAGACRSPQPHLARGYGTQML